MFIGRENELAKLEKAYSEEGFRLFVVSGSQGSGKTTLLEQFCRNKAAIYFNASRGSSRSNLNAFSSKILHFFADNEHKPFQFWDNALSHIARTYKGYRIIVVIEGLDILAGYDAALLGVLARVIDSELKYSAMMMVVSCGNAGFLKNTQLLHCINGVIQLGKFLNDENIARLKAETLRQSGMDNRAKFVRVPADAVILHEGRPNCEMYKIISGRALCFTGYGTDGDYLLGKTFGEYSLLTGKPGIYTVTAFTDMLLLKIPRGDFMNFIGSNPRNSIDIMRNMAGMLNVLKVNIDMLREELSEPPQ